MARLLKIASYNVCGCVGRDGRTAPERVAQVICELGVSVVALQGVGARDRQADAADQLETLAAAVGMGAVAGPSLASSAGDHGNGLLTALPVRSIRPVDLSIAGCEPRGALVVEMSFAGTGLYVVSLQLGGERRERGDQLRRLFAVLDSLPAGPVIVAGDLNEWWPHGGAVRRLRKRFGRSAAPPTYPARLPVVARDRIWAQPRGSIVSVAVHRSPLAREACDHLPVTAAVRVAARVAEGEPAEAARVPFCPQPAV